jgi:hypothetical protein
VSAPGAASRADRIALGLLLRSAELPALAGPRWPSLCWSLRDRLGELRAAGTEADRERIARGILDLVAACVPFSSESWLTSGLPDPGGGAETFRGPAAFLLPGALPGLLDRWLRPPMIRGEVEMTCPRALRAGSQAAVTIAFFAGAEPQEASPSLDLLAGLPVRVRVRGDGLAAFPGEQSLDLARSSLPCRLSFAVVGLRPGPGLLIAEVLQEGRTLEVLHARIQVEESPVTGAESRARAPFEAGGVQAPRPDALISARLEGERSLRICLEIDNAWGFATEALLHLEADPLESWRHLRRELEGLARAADPLRELERIGNRLYRQLWPPQLEPALRALLAGDAISLQVVCSPPWLIPWELLRPFGVGFPAAEQFLCERFDLARWYLSERATRPRAELRLGHLACVFNHSAGGLPALRSESDAIQREAARRGVRLHHVVPADRSGVLRALEEAAALPVDAWHFGGHGDHELDNSDAAPLHLEGRTSLLPRDLLGKAESRLRAEQPLIFLNACRVGQGGPSFAGHGGGWPGQLVGNCGVGAVLAPLWAVDDRAAAAFAQAF